jgi:ferredoxin
VTITRSLERLAFRVLSACDALANRWYTWRFNPLYQSGTIALALYLVIVVTGLWLLLFYRVGAPWESVDRLTANLWWGNWVRGLHRYASDAAVVATAVHAFRMFAESRTWGARTLAWVSGGLLLFLLYLCGWTGYVMVWDTFGAYLTRELARMADALPIFSEPLSRAFTGEQPVPSVFFFITLFAHIGIPLAMSVLFWLHVKRLARPAMLPPRPLLWTVIGALTAVAVVSPLEMAPKADPFHLPASVPADVFYAFWVPISQRMGGGMALAGMAATLALVLSVPAFTRRRRSDRPAPSWVDPEICVGCLQCSQDCPYGAIEMVPRESRRSDRVAVVDPDLCVSCGICSGSCPPMGVGPAGRTGRDQLESVEAFVASRAFVPGALAVVGCTRGAGAFAPVITAEGASFYPTDCAGNLHTSVIEFLLRGGATGVLVASCPPRDCWNREGPRWLHARMYLDREAELQSRVDRARVRIAYANAAEKRTLVAALRQFKADVGALAPVAHPTVDGDAACKAAGEPASLVPS